MFCPNCKYEYKPGASRCPDCDVPLVSSLPLEPETVAVYDEPVTVLETRDASIILIAEGMLEAAGIQHWLRGEGASDVFAGAGMGVAPAGGEMKLVVPSGDADAARKALAELLEELKWHKEYPDRERPGELDEDFEDFGEEPNEPEER